MVFDEQKNKPCTFFNVDLNQIDYRFRFPGQYADEASGLYYNVNRYYDPEIGSYVTSDPIGLQGGLNTYAYAGASPTKYIDPDGLFLQIVIPACVANPAACAGAVSALGGIAYYSYQAISDLFTLPYYNSDSGDSSEGKTCPDESNQRGNPFNGEPNTWTEHPHGKQDRYYGNDGTPAVDIDYGHDHGQGSPHAHNWNNGVREQGVPVSPLRR